MVIATWVSRVLGPVAGGMALSFPFVIGSGLLFALSDSGEEFMRETAVGALRGLIPLALFLLVVVLTTRWVPPVVCLLAGVLAWLVCAFSLYCLLGR